MSGICSAHKHYEPGCPRCEAGRESQSPRIGAFLQTHQKLLSRRLNERGKERMNSWSLYKKVHITNRSSGRQKTPPLNSGVMCKKGTINEK